MYPVVYLTGTPAAGKTTVCEALKQALPTLRVLEYSVLLSDHLSAKYGREVTHQELRSSSATVITPADVAAVDNSLISATTALRTSAPVIVASHPATREKYGYRVLMFSPQLLARLNPTYICMLICSPLTIADRIISNPEGRPADEPWQVATHTEIQTSIATTYSFSQGVPLYYLESDDDAGKAVAMLLRLLSRCTNT